MQVLKKYAMNPINQLDHIYNELGEKICLYPFFGAFYQTNNVVPTSVDSLPNSVRPCSIVMSNNRNKWDVINNSVVDSRNSENWRSIRQAMIDGQLEQISDCASCSRNEQAGATSPRQMNNKFYSEFLSVDIVKEVQEIVSNNNTVKDILTLDYYPSNYCNYSCVMCAGGASSQRQTFEVQVLGRKEKIVLNPTDPDFYSVLDRVEIINFTGGETALQKQVHKIMDYLIEKDLAKNIMITLLTNASSSANELMDKFKHFKQVIYNVSIDGTESVIEYQRRGCRWSDVEANSLELMFHPSISTVINYVLSAINATSIMDFINWAYDNKIGPTYPIHLPRSYINVSPVFRVDHLGVGALPPELRQLALSRLANGRLRFSADTIYDNYYRELVDRYISVIEYTEHCPEFIPQFVRHIRKEDSVSKKPLVEVVPEWAPWF
jgi:MoaA/NifB/PqqE/SkfB family radical SAM enzyme